MEREKDARHTPHILKNPKLEQKMALLFADSTFQGEVVALRKKFKELIGADKKLSERYVLGKTAEAVTSETTTRLLRESTDILKRLTDTASLSPEKFHEELGKLEAAHRVEMAKEMSKRVDAYQSEREKLHEAPGFREAIIALIDRYTKYNLTPKDVWRDIILNYIVRGKAGTPWQFSVPVKALIPLFLDIEKMVKLPSYNFGITVTKNEETGEPELYVRIFDTTSKDDVVRGWGVIDVVRKEILGKRRHYPLKNLDRYRKIMKIDHFEGGLSDWEKQEKVFGSDGTVVGLRKEAGQRKKLKQGRHYIKKRFGTTS